MDEISQELGVDLHTESLLVRAEQLARLESDKLVDKVRFYIQILANSLARSPQAVTTNVVDCVCIVAVLWLLRLPPSEIEARANISRHPMLA